MDCISISFLYGIEKEKEIVMIFNTTNLILAVPVIVVNILTLRNLWKYTGKSLIRDIVVAISFFTSCIIIDGILSVFYETLIPLEIFYDLLFVLTLLIYGSLLLLTWELYKYLRGR